MTDKNEMICIVCPIGCMLTVEKTKDGIQVSGGKCPRGIPYAKQELKDPKRTITSTVRIDGWVYPVIPVKTASPIPKNKIFDVMKVLSDVVIKAPINVGDVVVKNILNLDVDIVASNTVN